MLFCMRVMVGVIILYDHVHPVGAFAKTSKIDVSARIAHMLARSSFISRSLDSWKPATINQNWF